jgi:hypothetical protein
MFRGLLFALGAGIVACVGTYFVTGKRGWLRWAWQLLLGALGLGVLFFAVLLVKRLI